MQDLSLRDAWEALFLPRTSINFSGQSTSTIYQVDGSEAKKTGESAKEKGYLSSGVNFQVDYTLFNAFNDWFQYEQTLLQRRQSLRQIEADQRAARFEITATYFRTRNAQERFEVADKNLKVIQEIYGLLEAKNRVAKNLNYEISYTRDEILNSQRNIQSIENEVLGEMTRLNTLLDEPPSTIYKLTSAVPFQPLKVDMEELNRSLPQTSVNILSSRDQIAQAELSLQLEKKRLLPLPIINLTGLSLGYIQNYYQTKNNSGNGNINVAVGINLTIPIFGQGGLFNNRGIARAELNLDNAQIQSEITQLNDYQQLISIYRQILATEQELQRARERFQNSTLRLEGVIQSFSKTRGIEYAKMKDSIFDVRQSELSLKDLALRHLEGRIQLMQLLGTEHLPGEKP